MTSAIIRSTFNLSGDRLKCIEKQIKGKTVFVVQNNFQIYYKSEDIDNALIIFEALALEEKYDESYVNLIDKEIKLNPRYRYDSEKIWYQTIFRFVSNQMRGLRRINTGKLITWKENAQT